MDTRNKRASALGFALAALVVLPAPDGTVAAADWQQTTFSYAGLTSSAPVLVAPDLVELTATFARTVTATGTFARVISLTVER